MGGSPPLRLWLCSHQIIEATTTAEDSKPAFEAEFSPDLTHPNVVQTFKASSVPITVRAHLQP